MTRTSAKQLIEKVLDPGSFVSWDTPPEYGDISDDYKAALAKAREKTGVDEAVITGKGEVAGQRVAFVLSEFGFLGGSIGAATAQRIIKGIHRATAESLPLLISPSSGGTRMQEGSPAFALMVSITTAVYRHKEAHLPFLVYLRNPTTGGVMASWGSAGHFTFAEPDALLGFLGPRVVELTTGTAIPDGVQSGENLADKGIIDGVISPAGLRFSIEKIARVLLSPRDFTAPPELEEAPLVKPESTWAAIEKTRSLKRPGLQNILDRIGQDNVILLSGTTDGRRSPAIKVVLSRIGGRPVVIIGQDRHSQKPHADIEMGTEALRFARRGIALAHDLQIPLISFIDTPGAELSQHAEENAMAGSIARTLGELVYVDVPTVSVILGQGCGGGALAMLPSDKVLATSNGWLSPLPPEGASAIIYRDTEHAPQMMEEQQVGAFALKDSEIIDDIIPEANADEDPEGWADTVLAHVTKALHDLENNPARVGREQRFRHYELLSMTLTGSDKEF